MENLIRLIQEFIDTELEQKNREIERLKDKLKELEYKLKTQKDDIAGLLDEIEELTGGYQG